MKTQRLLVLGCFVFANCFSHAVFAESPSKADAAGANPADHDAVTNLQRAEELLADIKPNRSVESNRQSLSQAHACIVLSIDDADSSARPTGCQTGSGSPAKRVVVSRGERGYPYLQDAALMLSAGQGAMEGATYTGVAFLATSLIETAR